MLFRSAVAVSLGNATEELQKPVDTEKKIEIDNASKVAENQDFLESEGDEVDLEDGVDIEIEGTQLENSDEGAKTGNFVVEEQGKIQPVAQDANGSVVH